MVLFGRVMKASFHTHTLHSFSRLCLLALFALCPLAGFGAQTVLPAGSNWRYLDTGANLGTTWRTPDFNDSSWSSGAAPLGYGDPVATTIGFGPDPNAKFATTYFRTRFVVDDPSLYGSLEVRLRRDDGGVVYLNGVEIFRNNIGQGEILSTTFASSVVDGVAEKTFFSGAAPNLRKTLF